MNQQACEQFMSYMESIRTANNTALIDAIQNGFALTESRHGFRDAAEGAVSTVLALLSMAGLGGAGYAAIKGIHGDDAHRMEKRVQVDNSLQKRGWTDIPVSWDGKEVNGRDVSWYQENVDGLGYPHITMSPDGTCTFDVLTGTVKKLAVPGDINGPSTSIGVNDAYNQSMCPTK